jgi:hypothetical protein
MYVWVPQTTFLTDVYLFGIMYHLLIHTQIRFHVLDDSYLTVTYHKYIDVYVYIISQTHQRTSIYKRYHIMPCLVLKYYAIVINAHCLSLFARYLNDEINEINK